MHRTVDETAEVITATDVAPGDVSKAFFMFPLLDKHEATTGVKADTVVADSKYGTIDNFLGCYDKGIRAHIPDLGEVAHKRIEKTGIFSDARFLYDPDCDTYCSDCEET